MEKKPMRGMPDRAENSEAARPRPTPGFILANIHIGTGRSLWTAVVKAAEQHDVNPICFPGGGLRASTGFEAQRNAIYDLVKPESVNGLISWSSRVFSIYRKWAVRRHGLSPGHCVSYMGSRIRYFRFRAPSAKSRRCGRPMPGAALRIHAGSRIIPAVMNITMN